MRKSPTEHSGWKNWKRVSGVVRQENEREDQGEGVQNSGKTSTDVQGRDIGIEGKEIGRRRNENAMNHGLMDMRSYEAGQDKKRQNKRDNESGGNHKESPGKKVEAVWACDEKRGTLRKSEGGRWK